MSSSIWQPVGNQAKIISSTGLKSHRLSTYFPGHQNQTVFQNVLREHVHTLVFLDLLNVSKEKMQSEMQNYKSIV